MPTPQPFSRFLRLGVMLAFLMALLPTQNAFASGVIRHVKMGGVASGECLTWATACDFQYALATKAAPGDQLWVRQGVYKPGINRTDSFALQSDVAIYGGFAGTETLLSQRKPAVNLTVLSGDIGVANDSSDNSLHVVTAGDVAGPSSVLDGFTITAGNANDTGSAGTAMGGGMAIWGSLPTLRNLTFSHNTALNQGGGMVVWPGSPALTNVTFIHNAAGDMGGGLYNKSGSPVLTHVTFTANTAKTMGGGMLNTDGNPVLTSVTFNGNSVSDMGGGGGGMFNEGTGTAVLNTVSFSNNMADMGGGMINSAASVKLTGVTFSGNGAKRGGGLYNSGNPTLTTVVFRSNWADYGGGLYNANYGGTLSLKKSSFSGNTATYSGGGMYNDGGNLTLAGVVFKYNQGGFSGGGLYSQNGDGATTATSAFSKVTFTGNIAINGGGMYNTGANAVNNTANLTNVIFAMNRATGGDGGGGLYNDNIAHLSRVVFNDNSADEWGGGMYNKNSSTSLSNVIFNANSAGTYGGGMFNLNSGGAILTAVTFSRNSSLNSGGGLANSGGGVGLQNSTLTGNSATWGGAIYNDASSPQLSNVTISGNSASTAGGAMYNVAASHPQAYNTIFWADGAQEIANVDTSTILVDYGVLKGLCPAGGTCTHMIYKNPLLAPLANNGGFTKTMALQLGSSAIDKGYACESHDQRGVVRPQGPRCDIGAYEFVP